MREAQALALGNREVGSRFWSRSRRRMWWKR